MAEPTLTEVFGSGASQNSTTLTIAKADLPGLTASANNTAESLVVGLVLLLKQTLTEAGFNSNINQRIYFKDGFPGFTYRGANNDAYRYDEITARFAKPDTGATIDPDDY